MTISVPVVVQTASAIMVDSATLGPAIQSQMSMSMISVLTQAPALPSVMPSDSSSR